MDENDRNLNAEQLRKCARYFRALAAVAETTATARAELVRAAGQFEALARQRNSQSSEPPRRLRRFNLLCTSVSTNFLIHRGVAK